MSYNSKKAGGLAARTLSAALTLTIVADTTHFPSKHDKTLEHDFHTASHTEVAAISVPPHPQEPPHHPHIELREARQRRLEMTMRRGRTLDGDDEDILGFEPTVYSL